jgi:hypothetical protein
MAPQFLRLVGPEVLGLHSSLTTPAIACPSAFWFLTLPMTIFLAAGIVQVICLRGAEKARLRATTNVNWDCLLLRRVRKDLQW